MTFRQRAVAHCAAWYARRIVTGRSPNQRLRTAMRHLRCSHARPSTPEEAEHAVLAVTTASLRLGGTTACLPRCVAAVAYCRAHGHTPFLVIGIKPGTAEVHAWIEAAGQPSAEPSDPRTAYIPVAVFGATP